MSRIVNLKTVRFQTFNTLDSWYTNWSDQYNYSKLLHEDLGIRSYFFGICYRLKLPSNYVYIHRMINNTLLITHDLYSLAPLHRSTLRFYFMEQQTYFQFMLKLILHLSPYIFKALKKVDLSNSLYVTSRRYLRPMRYVLFSVNYIGYRQLARKWFRFAFNKRCTSIYRRQFMSRIEAAQLLNGLILFSNKNRRVSKSMVLYSNIVSRRSNCILSNLFSRIVFVNWFHFNFRHGIKSLKEMLLYLGMRYNTFLLKKKHDVHSDNIYTLFTALKLNVKQFDSFKNTNHNFNHLIQRKKHYNHFIYALKAYKSIVKFQSNAYVYSIVQNRLKSSNLMYWLAFNKRVNVLSILLKSITLVHALLIRLDNYRKVTKKYRFCNNIYKFGQLAKRPKRSNLSRYKLAYIKHLKLRYAGRPKRKYQKSYRHKYKHKHKYKHNKWHHHQSGPRYYSYNNVYYKAPYKTPYQSYKYNNMQRSSFNKSYAYNKRFANNQRVNNNYYSKDRRFNDKRYYHKQAEFGDKLLNADSTPNNDKPLGNTKWSGQQANKQEKQQFNKRNRQQYYQRNKQQFNQQNEQQPAQQNKQQFNYHNKQQADLLYDEQLNQLYNQSSSQQSNQQNKQQFNQQNRQKQQFNQQNKQQSNQQNKQQFNQQNKQQFNQQNKQQFNQRNKQQSNQHDEQLANLLYDEQLNQLYNQSSSQQHSRRRDAQRANQLLNKQLDSYAKNDQLLDMLFNTQGVQIFDASQPQASSALQPYVAQPYVAQPQASGALHSYVSQRSGRRGDYIESVYYSVQTRDNKHFNIDYSKEYNDPNVPERSYKLRYKEDNVYVSERQRKEYQDQFMKPFRNKKRYVPFTFKRPQKEKLTSSQKFEKLFNKEFRDNPNYRDPMATVRNKHDYKPMPANYRYNFESVPASNENRHKLVPAQTKKQLNKTPNRLQKKIRYRRFILSKKLYSKKKLKHSYFALSKRRALQQVAKSKKISNIVQNNFARSKMHRYYKLRAKRYGGNTNVKLRNYIFAKLQNRVVTYIAKRVLHNLKYKILRYATRVIFSKYTKKVHSRLHSILQHKIPNALELENVYNNIKHTIPIRLSRKVYMKLRYKLFCRLKRQIIAKIRKRVRIKLQKGYFAKMRNALFLKLRAVSANKFKKKKVHSLSKRKQRIRLDNRKMNFQKVFRIPLFVRKRSPSESYKKKIRKKINRYSLIKDRLLKRKRIIDITLRNQYKSRKKHQLRENNNKYALLKTKHRYTFLNEQYKRLIFRLRKALCCNVLDTRLLAEKDEQLELLSCKRTLIQWEYAHWVDSTSLKFNLFREQFISRQIVRRSMIRWQCIKQLSAQRKIYQKRIVMCRSTLKRLITQQREIHLFLIKQKPLLRRLLKLRKKCAKRKRYIVKLLLKQPRFNTPLIKKKKRPINKRQYYERRIYKWQLNQKLKFKKQQKQFKRQNKQQYNQRNRQQNYQQYNRSKSINTQHKGLHYNRWDNRETPFYLRQNVGNKWHNNLQHYNGYKYRDVKNRKIHDKCRPKPTFIRRFKLNHLLYSIKQTMSTILLLTKVYREFFVYNIRTQHRALLNTFDSRRSLVPFINSIKRIRITFFRGGYVPTSFKMLPWYFQAKTMLSPFIKMLNSYISMHIEKVLEQYTKLNVHCLLNIFFVHRRCFAPILNAKMICDFMVYLIHDNRSVRSAFYKIRQWQIDNMNRKQRLERISYLSKFKKTTTSYLEQFAFKKYPILSIRIECSGNAKKGTMSRKFFYGDIVNSPMFIQKSPNNTFSADLDYYQSFAITKSCSIGIKVWTFFKTHLYNKNGKLRSMFFY